MTTTEPLPLPEYVAAVTQAIDHTIAKIRIDLAAEISEETIFCRLFELLCKSDPPAHDSTRMHGVAAAALVRLAKALEAR